MEKKYELIKSDNMDLFRIKALRDFSNVKVGDIGGYVGSENNLSHEGDCWIYNNAKIFGNAMVFGNARIFCNAEVFSNATVFDNAEVRDSANVWGNAEVCDNAIIYGNVDLCGNTRVSKDAYIDSTTNYITIGPIGSRDSYTTFYKTKDNGIGVNCGCFNGTIEKFKDAVEKTHKDNDIHRNTYLTSIIIANTKLNYKGEK